MSQRKARTSEVLHFDLFELRDGKLYFRDKSTPLTTKKGGLKSVNEIVKILGKEGLQNLDFNISKGTVTAQQALMLNLAKEEMPSASDVDKVDFIELEEIEKSTEALISCLSNQQSQTDDLLEYPL